MWQLWLTVTHSFRYLLNWYRTCHTYVNQPVSEWIVCSAQIYCCITCFLCPMSSSFLDYSFILVEHFLHFLRKGAQEVNILKGRGLKISLSYIWLWLIKNSRLEIISPQNLNALLCCHLGYNQKLMPFWCPFVCRLYVFSLWKTVVSFYSVFLGWYNTQLHSSFNCWPYG